MNAGVYRVTGRRRYRGHEPGTVFVATLAPGPERRALARGDIALVESIVPSIDPARLKPPRYTQAEAPTGASLIEGSGG